jgi:fatty acid-binding protein DegV
MKDRGADMDNQVIGISHADCVETASEMKAMIEEEFHPVEVLITSIGSAIGSHTGAGTISIFFLNKIPS